MNDKEFIKAIRSEVIDSNIQMYKDMFADMLADNTTEVTDPYWKKVKLFYGSLESPQREVLFSIMRQVLVDTLSNVLGIIDGGCILNDFRGDFELSMDGQSLAGDLQDLLLEVEEEGGTKDNKKG